MVLTASLGLSDLSRERDDHCQHILKGWQGLLWHDAFEVQMPGLILLGDAHSYPK
jgi:hypothetical protein